MRMVKYTLAIDTNLKVEVNLHWNISSTNGQVFFSISVMNISLETRMISISLC